MDLDHHGTAVAEQIATGTATAGLVPVSAGPGVAATWGSGGVVDLLTGDSSLFTAGVGSWASNGGAVTYDSTYKFSFLNGSLKWAAPNDLTHYVEVPVAGTFKAGTEYQAVVACMVEETADNAGLVWIDLGLQGTDTARLTFSPNPLMLGATGWRVLALQWTPSADRTGVTLRMWNKATTSPATHHIGYARVAVAGGALGLLLFSDDRLQVPSLFAPLSGAGVAFEITTGQPGSGQPGSRIEFLDSSVHVTAAGPSPSTAGLIVDAADSTYIWGGGTAGDKVQIGVDVEAGPHGVGWFYGEKDATTGQFYADYGDYDFEFADGAAGRWRFRSSDNALAVPSMGMLPQYAADPTGVEGRMYYNTTTHKARCYNGTAWFDLF